MGLIGFAHFLSHFYSLSLPPLFVMIKPELGVSYVELGLVVAVSAIATGLLQTPCGFLVDRIGARRVLVAGLALFAGAVAAAGLVESYYALLVVWFLGGVGNSVFHPADYAILSATVGDRRLGRAFSIHAFGGSTGLAVAPFVMLTLASLSDWRTALIVVGLIGLVLAAVIALFGTALRDPEVSERRQARSEGTMGGVRLLLSRQMIMFFLFFMCTAAAGAGINAFGVVALVQLFGVDLGTAGQALTLYLILTSAGVLLGGWLADRGGAHDLIVMAGFGLAGLGFLVAGLPGLPFWLAVAGFAFAGLMRGAINPARDVMTRNAAPPGSVGKVFAFVTTGYTVSGALIPPMFGWLMDAGAPAWTFWTATIFSALGIVIVMLSRQARPKKVAAESDGVERAA